MKKVLLVVPLSTLEWGSKNEGGVDSVCQMLVKGLQCRGNESYSYHIVAFDPSNELQLSDVGKTTKLNENVQVVTFRTGSQGGVYKLLPNLFYQLEIIKKELAAFEPDIIHVHLQSWSLLFGTNKPIVTTLHSFKKICRKKQSKFNNFLYEVIVPSLASLKVERYTCVSSQFRQMIKDEITQPIDVVYNPISEEYLSSSTVCRHNNNVIRLVTCALLTRRKGIHHIIEVVKKLVDTGYLANLTVIGPISEKSYFEELNEQITKYGLAENVDFVGAKTTAEIINYYADSSVGIFLSQEETFGLVPIEMLASGLPVICTNTGVLHDLEHDNSKPKILHVFSKIDYLAIAKKIKEIHECHSIKESSIFIKNRFSIASIIKEYETIYNKCFSHNVS